jgi:hypothetical protein
MRLLVFLCCFPAYLFAQFPPPAGQLGSTAIHVDSANWLGWATNCQLNLGLQNIANPSLGDVSSGSAAAALGAAADGSLLSLGDGGKATLTFAYPIKDGPGPDFAVFENAFSDDFLELAFVEVSSDGQHFVRFPATSLTDTSSQIGTFGSLDATKINNLAGKYRYGYGTPFDLADLADSSGIDLQAITHVRIIDVIGSINPDYASRDHLGQIINDPYPTPFAEGGFDLDAVGVLHFNYQASVYEANASSVQIYPNPAQNQITIDLNEKYIGQSLQIHSTTGQLILQKQFHTKRTTLDLSQWPKGLYLLKIGDRSHKIVLY